VAKCLAPDTFEQIAQHGAPRELLGYDQTEARPARGTADALTPEMQIEVGAAQDAPVGEDGREIGRRMQAIAADEVKPGCDQTARR
jgi:hypothetical protein